MSNEKTSNSSQQWYEIESMNKVYELQHAAQINPDIDMIKEYLHLLDPTASTFYFTAIREGSSPWNKFADFDNIASEITKLNKRGYGIYVTVNETDASGRRKAENITRVRALFADMDIPQDSLPIFDLKPSFYVESSPGKYHAYWLVDDTVTPDQFRQLQVSIINKYGADSACKDVCRMLRLPGSYWCKRKNPPVEPVLSELIVRTYDRHNPSKWYDFRKYSEIDIKKVNVVRSTYKYKELAAALPLVKITEENEYLVRNWNIQTDFDNGKLAGAAEALRNSLILDDYDNWICCGMAIKSAMPEGAGVDLWKLVSSNCPKFHTPGNEEMMEYKWKTFDTTRGITFGTFYHFARQAGWKGEEIHLDADKYPFLDWTCKPKYLFTDAANGWRLAVKYGQCILNHPTGIYFWNGKCWELDKNKLLMEKMISKYPLAKLIADLEKLYEDDEFKALIMKKAAAAEQGKTMREALTQALTFLTHENPLDSNPYLFNANNGTIDLQTGDFYPHKQEDFLTKVAKVDYVPDAECPEFEKSLKRHIGIYDEDDNLNEEETAKVIEYYWDLQGYCLVRANDHKYFVILLGESNTNKSKLETIVVYVINNQAIVAPLDLIAATRKDNHPAIEKFITTYSKVVIDETERDYNLSNQFLKLMTGSGSYATRGMYKDYEHSNIIAKLFIPCNYYPKFDLDDVAMMFRANLIKFTHPISRGEMDSQWYKKIIDTESEGILAKLVEGAQRVIQRGIVVPSVVQKYHDELIANIGFIEDFYMEFCKWSPHYGAVWTRADLYARYREYAQARRGVPRDKTYFMERIKLKGHVCKELNGIKVYHNVDFDSEKCSKTVQKLRKLDAIIDS